MQGNPKALGAASGFVAEQLPRLLPFVVIVLRLLLIVTMLGKRSWPFFRSDARFCSRMTGRLSASLTELLLHDERAQRFEIARPPIAECPRRSNWNVQPRVPLAAPWVRMGEWPSHSAAQDECSWLCGTCCKGVRTVQRWERLNVLPIHRPTPFTILADTAALERWMHRNDIDAPSTSEPKPSFAGSVLVVDDGPALADTLGIILQRAGVRSARYL